MAFQTGRSGDEPLHARSALRLRLFLAGFGLACGIAGIVLFAVLSIPALLGLFAALAAVASVNIAVVVRHMRAGAAYQPGPEVPPYRPAPAERKPRPVRPEVSPRRRHARFIVAAIVTLVLIVNAWAWIWRLSVAASVALTIVAGVALLIGVVASNAGSPALRGNAIPEIESERGIPEADSDVDAVERAAREQEQPAAEGGTARGERGERGESEREERDTRRRRKR